MPSSRSFVRADLDDDFFESMGREVARARTLFPNSRHLLAALVEEVGELSEALIEHDRGLVGATREDIFDEAVQVASMAMRLATEGDPSFPKYVGSVM